MSKTIQKKWSHEERDYVLAQLATRSIRNIAEEIGVAADALESRVRHWKRQGPSGEPTNTTPAHVHAGLELKGQSTLVNAKTEKANLRWDKTGLPNTEPAPIPEGFHPTAITTLERGGVE